MGYVPILIRADLEPIPAQLYGLQTVFDVSTKFLGARRWTGLPRTYEEYVARTYGQPKMDWFLALNYGLLASVVALVIAIGSVLAR